MARGALAAAGAGAALAVGLLHASERWLRPERVHLTLPPVGGVEPLDFRSEDGVRLHGLLLRSEPGAPLAVFCHGYQRSIEETFALAAEFHARGYHSLCFDFRACGRSGGRYTTLGYREPADVRAAVRAGIARTGSERAVVHGISMGGASAILAAASEPRIAGLATDSAFAALLDAISQRLSTVRPALRPAYDITRRIAQVLARANPASVRPVDAVPLLAPRPLFLIHSRADEQVPYRQHELLRAAARGPVEEWVVDGVPHAKMRFVYWEEYLARVDDFFRRALAMTHGARPAPVAQPRTTSR